MRNPVFVGSAFVAQYPEGGGNFWVPLQYLLGLLDLGVDAWWLELLWTRRDPARDRRNVETFRRHVAELGVADRVVLVFFPESERAEPPGRAEVIGMDAGELAARQRDGLLLNMAESVPASLRGAFGRTALFDLDPGPFQLWALEWGMGVGAHDAHVTIGRHLGASDSPVPLGGVEWRRVWPAVHLPAWPVQRTPAACWTTVTQWWNNQYAFLDGDCYDCNKRSGFLEVIDLPARAGVPLELAANLHADEREDRELLARHGWRLADPAVVAGTPQAFRAYVQASRGELSCAKPAYVKARSGWVSDRTICYLASGRPCVVQATGAEAHLPASAGLRFFRSVDEAAAALAAVEADHAAAARAARALAEEVFATRVVVPELLAAAGA
ncbi:MAG TPA: hypothetical protein VKW76_14050 [Candidatus Binatia bacterium]|nr:hypothetical protein [Candidatus Binatia bacterium]